jgi:peptide/nickel transport system substrate-binding protein
VSLFRNLWVKIKSFQIGYKDKFSQRKKHSFNKHDEKLVQNLSARKKLPSWKQFKFVSEYLTKPEGIVIRILSGVIIIAVVSLLINVYWTHSEIVPKVGGSYTEGLVGAPRYINPLYAQGNDVDLDISSLVYSGLLKFTNDGLSKELAADYEISTDQLTYTFYLRQDVKWHDGEAFNADDVVFTFNRILDTASKTPLYFNFKGAKVDRVDDFTVTFVLDGPFAPFLESLSVGVLPEHIWSNSEPENMMLAEYNLKPIGTGPYLFKSLTKNKSGSIKSFKVENFPDYYLTPANIEEISFKFYESFEQAVEALNNKNVEGISYLPKEIRERIINNRNLNFHLLHLPQYTAVFFNYRNNPILKDAKLRKILTHAVDKETIANEILNAEVQLIDGPILPGTLGYTADTVKYPFNPAHAKAELDKDKWTLTDYVTKAATEDVEDKEDGEDSQETVAEEPIKEEYPYQVRKKNTRYFEFNLTTVNQPENVKIAKELQKNWQQIGAKVNLVFVHPNEIQEVIKTRDYETLLYGQILGLDPDPYPFWHSGQGTSPGLNLTSLVNSEIDKLLDEARKTPDDIKRAEKYVSFQKLLAESVPAVFLFNPTYTYPQNKKIKGFDAIRIISPSNRFNQVTSWFIKTDRSWK